MLKSVKKPALILLVVFILIISGCQSTFKNSDAIEKIRIGYLPITHSLPLITAKDLFPSNQVEWELVRYSSWPELTEALNAGQIDGAITMLELAEVSKSRGIPLKVVSLSHRNGDVLITEPGVNDIKDLAGKTIGIPHRLSGHNILAHIALEKAGVDENDVKFIELAPPDMPAALARREISAYIVAEPFGASSVVSGQGKVLLRAQDIWPDWICCGLVLREEIINNHPQHVQDLVNGIAKAGLAIQKDKQAALDSASRYYSADSKLLSTSLEWIDFDNLQVEEKDFLKLQSHMKSLSLIDKPVNLDDLLETQFIQAAYEGIKTK